VRREGIGERRFLTRFAEKAAEAVIPTTEGRRDLATRSSNVRVRA